MQKIIIIIFGCFVLALLFGCASGTTQHLNGFGLRPLREDFTPTFTFSRSQSDIEPIVAPAVVADFDCDGIVEPLGTRNDGSGDLSPRSASELGLSEMFVPEERPNDIRAADFNGDGCPDLIVQGYSSTADDTRALLYLNDGKGHFAKDQLFASLNFRGRGEGVVVADFNNDGFVDIFLPYYTVQPCAGLCPNSPQSYLLLNDGHAHFRDVARIAGLDFATAPGAIPEGAQAVDLNDDGRLDLYVAGRIMINDFIDADGVPHFRDCDCGIPPPPTTRDIRADEGAKFLDWNNDGLFDLIIHSWSTGPLLYENVGTQTAPRFVAMKTTAQGDPLFSSGAPNFAPILFQDSFGLNVYDLDGDGLEDVITSGSPHPDINQCLHPLSPTPCEYPAHVFINKGHSFETVSSAGELDTLSGNAMMAFADLNFDGKIDLIYSDPGSTSGYQFQNRSENQNGFIYVELDGSNGEHNQYGRVVRVSVQDEPGTVLSRVVDGGSGYHSQGQYPILIGTGEHRHFLVNAYSSTGVVTFRILVGQYAKVFAPSILHPLGQVKFLGEDGGISGPCSFLSRLPRC